MRRVIFIGIAVLLAASGGYLCWKNTRPLDKDVVLQAVSHPPQSRIEDVRAVIEGGDRSIPPMLSIVVSNGDSQYRENVLLILDSMAKGHKENPSAPYLRRVLLDSHQPVSRRCAAAFLLNAFWGSSKVRKAVLAAERHDPSVLVRANAILTESSNSGRVTYIDTAVVSLLLRRDDAPWGAGFCALQAAGLKVVPLVFAVLREESSEVVVRQASFAIEWPVIESRDSEPSILLDVAANPKEPDHSRLIAIETLMYVGHDSQKVHNLLRRLAHDDPSPKVRALCREAL